MASRRLMVAALCPSLITPLWANDFPTKLDPGSAAPVPGVAGQPANSYDWIAEELSKGRCPSGERLNQNVSQKKAYIEGVISSIGKGKSPPPSYMWLKGRIAALSAEAGQPLELRKASPEEKKGDPSTPECPNAVYLRLVESPKAGSSEEKARLRLILGSNHSKKLLLHYCEDMALPIALEEMAQKTKEEKAQSEQRAKHKADCENWCEKYTKWRDICTGRTELSPTARQCEDNFSAVGRKLVDQKCDCPALR